VISCWRRIQPRTFCWERNTGPGSVHTCLWVIFLKVLWQISWLIRFGKVATGLRGARVEVGRGRRGYTPCLHALTASGFLWQLDWSSPESDYAELERFSATLIILRYYVIGSVFNLIVSRHWYSSPAGNEIFHSLIRIESGRCDGEATGHASFQQSPQDGADIRFLSLQAGHQFTLPDYVRILASSSRVTATTVAGVYCARDGQAELSWVANNTMRWFTNLDTVTIQAEQLKTTAQFLRHIKNAWNEQNRLLSAKLEWAEDAPYLN